MLDLEHAVGLDADGDGAITWGELKERRSAIEDYALAHLKIESSGGSCATTASGLRVNERADGHYAVLEAAAICPSGAAALTVRYDLFFDLDPTHRGLLAVDDGSAAVTTLLSPDRRVFGSNGPSAGGSATFVTFVGEGVRHIFIGYDHIAFIVLLLLPAGLVVRRGTSSAPDAGARTVTLDILKVVSAFTIAHSLTLGLAATGLVVLPARSVEAAIAASVVVAALANLWPRLHAYRWQIAFGFGLVHGFGFANVLGELDLRGSALALPLAGFNVGVELGQLVIAAAALPVLLLLRRRAVYRRWVIPVCSAGIAVLAGYWLADRLTT